MVIRYNDLYIVSIYISSNISIAEYSAFLDDFTSVCTRLTGSAVICGDFNAHVVSWGSPSTDSRGHLVEEWATQFDFRLVNVGSCPTCIRPQDSFVIDLTWVSSDLARRVLEWRVREDILSLSDHLYITYHVSMVPVLSHAEFTDSRPRWNFKRANLDLFNAVLEWSCAVIPSDEDFFLNVGPDKWIKRIMDNACLVAVPRSRQHLSKPQMYWWNDDIGQLRKSAIRARRVWLRGRHRLFPEVVADLRRNYGQANRLVKSEIRRSKNCAWRELMAILDETCLIN